eukprot:1080595-Amphidinium_carterae.1
MSDTTPNHWQSCESLVRWLVHVDGILNKDIDPSTPWLVILDCAPVHCAIEFRQAIKAALPHLTLCYVAAGMTSVAQPLDR